MSYQIEAEEFIEERLVEPLLHGDATHREWLKEELRKWIPALTHMLEDLASDVESETREDVAYTLQKSGLV